MLELTEHFCERWREHFGEEPPCPERMLRLLTRCVWLNRQKTLIDAKDGTVYKLLATYWDTVKNVVIKVDWHVDKVVTLITAETKGRRISHTERAGSAEKR
jgi:hypothetical protein